MRRESLAFFFLFSPGASLTEDSLESDGHGCASAGRSVRHSGHFLDGIIVFMGDGLEKYQQGTTFSEINGKKDVSS